MADILLSTINARYMHSAFGLRYLRANLQELKPRSQITEFTLQQRPIDIAEALLAMQPKLIGFSVYIWNVRQISETLSLIKTIAPQVIIVLGGPEVSHSPDLPKLVNEADYVISGAGEISFHTLAQALLSTSELTPSEKFIQGISPPLQQLQMPYDEYDDEDIRHRLIYVEASRGCPFKCEFCLSSLDKTAKPFELGRFLDEMDRLHQRGVRNFKFIDRTFNLKVSSSIAILEFFLDRISDDLYLHFELIPDNLPERLKEILQKFPINSLQFEIGIQTFDPDIQQRISRKQDNQKSCENIRWLRENTGAHLHTDLIFGLPGDTLENFADSFNQLLALKPQEIQLGILKRLRGAPINRHTETYQLRYNPKAPYNILSTSTISFTQMQVINRYARFWDMLANSGRFKATLPLILLDDPFNNFLHLSEQLYQRAGSSWKISLKRQFKLVYQILIESFDYEADQIMPLLQQDYRACGQKEALALNSDVTKTVKTHRANRRQAQHL